MEQKQQFKREVAVKLRVSDLISGQYIKEEGLRPNYVLLKDGRKISRVNILGTVVSVNVDTGYKNVYIDDGTAKLSVRSFEQNAMLEARQVGDIVFAIGKPREYGREIYVLPEILKSVADIHWVELRALELKKQPVAERVIAPEIKTAGENESVAEEFVDDGSAKKLLDQIRSLDTGSGADYEAVVSKAGIENAEKALLNLLKNGEVFEVSPGKLKVLE
jgi:RPA family protein